MLEREDRYIGYTTDFTGGLKFNEPLTVIQANWLRDFSEDRHEGYDENYQKKYPGIWCQWVANSDGTELVWDGVEKFYNYVEWLEWLIDNYFRKENIVLNGSIRWQGEDFEDVGIIHVKDNIVTTEELKITGAVECPNCGEKFLPNEE